MKWQSKSDIQLPKYFNHFMTPSQFAADTLYIRGYIGTMMRAYLAVTGMATRSGHATI